MENKNISLVLDMALTLTLSGNTSNLHVDYFPPIELSTYHDYVCGLVDFQTYNSIPNVDNSNNLFHIADETIEIPMGSYEIDDIANYITSYLKNRKNGCQVNIRANNNTLKSLISSNAPIYLNKDRSIGSLLGFSKRELNANQLHMSDLNINIIKVNAIRIECSIVTGAYINNSRAHTIHEFSTVVGPGYKIVEVPRNVIYLPVNVKQVTSLTLKIVDQDGDLINFRGETITARLHLKPHHVNI